ncbi:MAG: sterol desaturase family protein [Bacteroidota bacterium]|nr:sterol desaturase family protein [Bacteroidota bacterium]
MFFAETWYGLLIIIALRYFLIAGVAYLFWYKIKREKIAYKKIQLRFPRNKDYRREIFYSLITIVIFAAVPAAMLLTPFRQYTQYYQHVGEYSIWWFWLAFPIMFIVHDTYFYWMHRIMHHPKLFRSLHLVHHQSTNPSPWAAFSFQPAEAFFEAGIFVILITMMPLHLIHLFVFFLVMMVYNVYGHLGWELYPSGFSKHPIGKWINTSVNHNQHHQFFTGNYGLYFLFWDRLMGTLRTDYDPYFEQVTARLPSPAKKQITQGVEA